MGCFYVASVLGMSLVFFLLGEPIPGLCCIYGSYYVLMFYNRLEGDGEPTFTYEQCKQEWEQQQRGK